MGREVAVLARPGVDPWGVVAAKLRPPALRRGVLARSALVDRLARSHAPVVGVLAGAGYGKTTLARQWIATESRPSAWVTVDSGDDDPVVFLRHVVRALDQIEPLPDVEAALAHSSVDVGRTVLPALSTALDSAARTPFLLVLDDAHRLASPAALDVLDRLIEVIPAGSTLAVVGRPVAHLRFARRRLEGTAEVVGQDALRFDEADARALLVRGLPGVDDATLGELVARTEGWPAALHLAVLALRDTPDPASSVHTVTPGHDLTDYFHQELLAHLDPATRWFLVRTSILERFTAGLCDAVLERSGSAAVLDELVASGNQFVVQLDGEPLSFRYHPLFAELLVAELRRTAPDEEPELRRRAARYLARHGRGAAAVTQAIASGDVELAAEVIYGEMQPALNRGHTASLERWLDELGPDAVRTLPLLAVVKGWLELSRQASVDYWVELAQHLVEASAEDGGRLASSGGADPAVAVASLAMCAGVGGVRRGIEDARLVRAAGPVGNPLWGQAWLSEAQSLLAAGELADPVAAYAAAEQATRGSSISHAIALANLAHATARAGDGVVSWQLLQEAVDTVHAAGVADLAIVVLVWAVDAALSAERGLVERSVTSAARAEQVLTGLPASMRALAQARLLLAEAACARGDARAAQRALAVVEEHVRLDPAAAGFRAWAQRLATRLDVSRALGLPRLSDAERRVLVELPSHLSLEEIGQKLFVSRHTVKTHAMSIYRKLGVNGRSAAVDRARQLGLLAPAA